MKRYKVFQPNWTCRGFKYEVGKTYEEDVKPECCKIGFHFCTDLVDCFNYYPFNPKNKVAEVRILEIGILGLEILVLRMLKMIILGMKILDFIILETKIQDIIIKEISILEIGI